MAHSSEFLLGGFQRTVQWQRDFMFHLISQNQGTVENGITHPPTNVSLIRPYVSKPSDPRALTKTYPETLTGGDTEALQTPRGVSWLLAPFIW